MDVLTPKGQKTVEQERRAVEIWLKHFPNYLYIETPKDRPAVIDAVISLNGVMQAAVETKCRNTTLDEFRNKHNSESMINYDKFLTMSKAADLLQIPLVIFMYMVTEDVLLYDTVWDSKEGWLRHVTIKHMFAKATINQGKVKKLCAFIDMKGAKVLKGE
jgi:hypothetical protein